MTKQERIIAKLKELIEAYKKLIIEEKFKYDHQHIYYAIQGCLDSIKHLKDLIVEFESELAAIESEQEEKYDSNLCTICHQNYVDSANGYDTCKSCMKNI